MLNDTAAVVTDFDLIFSAFQFLNSDHLLRGGIDTFVIISSTLDIFLYILV